MCKWSSEGTGAGTENISCTGCTDNYGSKHNLPCQDIYLYSRGSAGVCNFAYMDSSGCGMLERLSRKTKLRVALPPGAVVHRAFVVTGLAQVVPVFPSVADALVHD